MDRERIFNLVRKEEVILWAGSGLSIYAGFPSGADLAKKIMAELSREERESINVGNDLASIAEDFVNIRSGSRNELNMILGNIFNRTPDSTKLHDIIAKIPHIKRIITTNYDKLFELAYKNECVVIINAKDTSNLSDRKVAIF